MTDDLETPAPPDRDTGWVVMQVPPDELPGEPIPEGPEEPTTDPIIEEEPK